MPKTYTTIPTVNPGDAILASSYNTYQADNVNNLIVPPAVRVYNSASINPYTSGNAITWNSESYDTDGMHSTSTNTGRITIQTDGIYRVFFQLRASWSGTMTAQAAIIRLNNSDHSVVETFGISTTVGGSWIQASCVSSFVATDYLTAHYNVSGATSPIVLTPSYFAAEWIGKTS